jgi:hypothetical protein
MLHGEERLSQDAFKHATIRLLAPANRLGYSRAAILFAAIAAEAYANAFIATPGRFTASDVQALDRMSTVDKLVLTPRLVGYDVFDRGKEPITSLAQLFDLRNALVHPKPEEYEPQAELFPEEPHGFDRFNPRSRREDDPGHCARGVAHNRAPTRHRGRHLGWVVLRGAAQADGVRAPSACASPRRYGRPRAQPHRADRMDRQ